MKIGRNEPCPCGSGKKYKKCCLAKDEAIHLTAQPAMETPGAEAELDHESWEETEASQSFDLGKPPVEVEAHDGLELDEWEEDNYSEEEIPESGEVKYPRPDEKLPELTPEQEKIIK